MKANPAINYKLVMNALEEKMGNEITNDNRQMWLAWDYLYKLSIDECTHKNKKGESSIIYPFDHLGIDYKICLYCSSS